MAMDCIHNHFFQGLNRISLCKNRYPQTFRNIATFWAFFNHENQFFHNYDFIKFTNFFRLMLTASLKTSAQNPASP